MSIKDLWQLLKKKGYDPRVLFLPQLQPQEAGTIRVDLQACFYSTLMKAASLPEQVMFNKLATHYLRCSTSQHRPLYRRIRRRRGGDP